VRSPGIFSGACTQASCAIAPPRPSRDAGIARPCFSFYVRDKHPKRIADRCRAAQRTFPQGFATPNCGPAPIRMQRPQRLPQGRGRGRDFPPLPNLSDNTSVPLSTAHSPRRPPPQGGGCLYLMKQGCGRIEDRQLWLSKGGSREQTDPCLSGSDTPLLQRRLCRDARGGRSTFGARCRTMQYPFAEGVVTVSEPRDLPLSKMNYWRLEYTYTVTARPNWHAIHLHQTTADTTGRPASDTGGVPGRRGRFGRVQPRRPDRRGASAPPNLDTFRVVGILLAGT